MSDGSERREIRDRELYDRMPVSITVSDPSLPDNPLVYVNPAFTHLTGYTADAACGRNCRFLQGENTKDANVRDIADAIAAETPIATEIVNYTASGRRFLNSLIVTPIRDGGKTIFFLGLQAGWLPHEGQEADPKQVRKRLEQLTGVVEDNVGSVLKLLRKQATEDVPERVIDLLSSRLNCLALLYANVFRTYDTEAFGEVRLGAYLSRVCSATHLTDKSYNTRFALDLAECTTDIKTAASVGLVLSEILTNAYEKANPYDDAALIEVALEHDNGEARLTVMDSSRTSGAGLLPPTDSVGGQLLDALEPDLDGTIEEARTDQGSVVTITLGGVSIESD